MLKDIQRSDAVKKLIGKRQRPAVVKLAPWTNLLRALDIWRRNIHAIRFKPGICQTRDDLPYPAPDIQHASTWALWAKRIRVLGVKTFVPAGEKLGVSFILFVGFLMP